MKLSFAIASIAAALLIAPVKVLNAAQDDSSTSTAGSAEARCAALGSADFSTIQDAAAQVIQAKAVPSSSDGPAYCQVTGYVTPNVGFELRLPTSDWNGKFIEIGCGGSCGHTNWLFWCPLRRGYACIASDMGHKGKNQDGLWAYNNLQAQVDFGYRGAHVTALAGKAITEHYYSRAPKYSYFHGCSSGGRQAMVEAERFPWDFDGIIGGAPWIDDSDSAMNFVWAIRALKDKDGKLLLSRADLQLVHDAALAKCDMDDGVKDGLISDPHNCKFDPSELTCKMGQSAHCLSAVQVAAVNKIYDGPTTSKGIRIYSHGSVRGSEMGWIDEYDGMDYAHSNYSMAGTEEWALEYFRYMVMPAPGASWQLADFDFDRDYKRFAGGVQESLLSAANPDMSKFKAAGGKLMVYQGWNDQSDVPDRMIDYYETATRTMGGRAATQNFFRLFVIPGMKHCTAGDGAFAVDYLTYLEAWVEHGRAPDVIIGSHVKGVDWGQSLLLKFPLDPATPVSFTRPIYPYPTRAKYKGSGDSNDAANFVPVAPPR